MKVDIDGLILLDKPTGITSNRALQQVKHALHAKKAGHTGSLDPLATGMLPICLGQATKFSQFLLDADKTYRVTARLGIRTTTSDAEGEIVSQRDVPVLKTEVIEKKLTQFRGEISQVPSMYSALKHNGQPLYKYARQGIEVPREARNITIYRLELLQASANELELLVHCSKGTYVRTLVDDLGELLACGAHVVALRRLSVGQFKQQDMHPLEHISTEKLSSLLLPVESLLTSMPTVAISPALAFYLKQGQAVFVPNAPTSGLVNLAQANGTTLGVGVVLDDGKIAPRKMLATQS